MCSLYDAYLRLIAHIWIYQTVSWIQVNTLNYRHVWIRGGVHRWASFFALTLSKSFSKNQLYFYATHIFCVAQTIISKHSNNISSGCSRKTIDFDILSYQYSTCNMLLVPYKKNLVDLPDFSLSLSFFFVRFSLHFVTFRLSAFPNKAI